MNQPIPLEITCREVQEKLARQEDLLLLDCRNPDEFQLASLAGAKLLPMHELPERLAELEPFRAKPVVVYCHLGGRSARVAAWLREQGFSAHTMAGGIDQWAIEIDPSLPRY